MCLEYVCIWLHLFALERYAYRCMFMFTSFFKNPTSNCLLVYVFVCLTRSLKNPYQKQSIFPEDR